MVKSYLKYEFSSSFALVASPSSNVLWTKSRDASSSSTRSQDVGQAVVGANEEVLSWDLKKGTLISRWRDGNTTSQVTTIAQSHTDPDIFAVGYADGSIRIWDSRLASVLISFTGHRSGVTCLAFDSDGTRLASGSSDTNIVIWDLISERGLHKFRGHKNQVTGLAFLRGSTSAEDVDDDSDIAGLESKSGADNFLLSTGKDGLIKLWDLNSQYCIETHVAHASGECWGLSVAPSQDGCLTIGNDGEFRVWQLDRRALHSAGSSVTDSSPGKILQSRGSIYRHYRDRTLGVQFHPNGRYIAVHGAQKGVEIYRVRSPAEVQKSLARKKRRKREKEREKTTSETNGITEQKDEQDAGDIDVANADIAEFVVPHLIVRPGGKAKSVEWCGGSKKDLRLLIATSSNQLEVYDIQQEVKGRQSKSNELQDYSQAHAIDVPGHRTDIRALSLSADDRMLASASNGSLKIWNVRTNTCIRTLSCGYAMCCAFLPGDKIVIVGTKDGQLELYDIASSTWLENVHAHDGSVFSLHIHPDGKSVVSGGGDKTAKFWNFQIAQEQIPGTTRSTGRLRLVHARTLKVSDEILSVKFSPDGKLLAVSLLDYTVKVFFTDSLKLFLNLYGHKLPVLSMDISFDSKLIVTCSADKNVRIWGLDFGDCHKAFFAHQDSVMQVGFVPHNRDGNGHHFFSVSKDRLIKYWDGDKFEQIQRLDGHHGEIWAFAVSGTGDFIVTAAHDKSIRVWQQTDEQIFLEEEREKELEEMYEKTLTTSLDDEEDPEAERAEAVEAGHQTAETLMAGERIMEALDLGLEDLELVREWHAQKATQPNIAPPQRNLIFVALGNIAAEEHVLGVIQKIKAAALQDALLVLSLERVIKLFTFIEVWAQRQWDMPLTCRVLFFLLKTHHKQLVASRTMRPMLDSIRRNLRGALQRQKDDMGYNMAALQFVGAQVRSQGASNYVDEETWEGENQNKSHKKRAFIDVA